MELMPGYKQTEVGVIPEEWGVSTVGREFEIKLGKMLDAEKNTGVPKPYLGNKAVQWGAISWDDLPTVPMTRADMERFRLRKGDLLVCEGGEIGRSAIWQGPIEECYYQKAIHRLRSLHGFDPSLMAGLLRQWSDSGRLANYATKTSIAHLPREKFLTITMPVPPHAEQRLISGVLSDIDSLLTRLESIIAKKCNIKQAAMQELLTGKRRLPGFEGEWEVKRLGSVISDLEAGVSVVSLHGNDQPSTGRFVLKTSAVTNGQLITSESKEITPADLSRAKTSIKKDDLIISRMNTPALVGECGYSESDCPHLFLPDRLWRVSYQNPATVSSRWLAYSLSFDQNKTRIKELATGTSGSMKNISKHALLSLSIQWPTLAEQLAIAECLTSLDDELNALSSRLEKTCALKQAMMQELLTGRIRLR